MLFIDNTLRAFPVAFVMFCGAAGTPLPYRLRAVPVGIHHVYFVGDSGRARRPWRAAGYWKKSIGVSAKHRVGQRRPRRAAG